MKTRTLAICALVLALCLTGGCSLFGGQPGRSAEQQSIAPTPVRTAVFTSATPGRTASQDTAGASTRLPEAATAAGAATAR